MSARATTDTPHAEREARALAPVPGVTPLHGRLSPERWRHTLSVAETAYRLAEAFGWPEPERARAARAALLHDIAKELPAEDIRRLAAEPLSGLPGDALAPHESAPRFAGLLHAAAGARVAARDFGIADGELLRAIATHPTSTSDASDLAHLLFVADYLEPGRPQLDASERELLAAALAGALDLPRLHCRVLHRKLTRMLQRNLAVHPLSVATWNAHCAGGG